MQGKRLTQTKRVTLFSRRKLRNEELVEGQVEEHGGEDYRLI